MTILAFWSHLGNTFVQVRPSHGLVANVRHVTDDVFGRFRLSGPGLAADEDALRATGAAHVAVGGVGDTVHVRLQGVTARHGDVAQVPLTSYTQCHRAHYELLIHGELYAQPQTSQARKGA